ncbi:hypothetical protein FIBSPDRAFT_1038531 [Athelia psychrophila]|uniref:PIH1 N-terminal domain-containing protein n=1 Tax=Athelia psychrophila TaxID=1759441 RepID=A0A166T5J8_9AGAM|nr:hypothetical protein FIBSPDRAFT_1038531 [Fibularhizoctonia sp. CBS 109695]
MSSGFTSSSGPPPASSLNPAQPPPSSSSAPLQLRLHPATQTSSSQPTQHRPASPSPRPSKSSSTSHGRARTPPPAGSEDIIQCAMLGMDEDKYDAAQPEEGGYYVPVVVSAPREDTDKKGAKALVFDAVFHTSVKGRATRDEAFKAFVVDESERQDTDFPRACELYQLALQRIEAQSHAGRLQLFRQIGTPNLTSKGALAPRRVQIPSALFAAASSPAPSPAAPDALNITGTGTGTAGKAKGKKLIEEVEGPPNSTGMLKGEAKNGSVKAKTKTNVKGILKPAPKGRRTDDPAMELGEGGDADQDHHRRAAAPLTTTICTQTHAHIPSATLDLEPRRILLAIPGLYALDVPLDAPDAELVAASAHLDSDGTTTATAGGASWEAGALGLKRAGDLDVDGARAEWRVEEGCLAVYALFSLIPATRAYMVHTIRTPSTAPTISVCTVAGTRSCCETGLSHPAGSVSGMDAAKVMLEAGEPTACSAR